MIKDLSTGILITTVTATAAILWNLNSSVISLTEKIAAVNGKLDSTQQQTEILDNRVRILEARK